MFQLDICSYAWLMIVIKPERVPQELAKRLARARKEKGMTQDQLQDKTGIPSFYLSRIENGVRKPTVVTLKKLTNALGITLEELFRGL